MYLGIDGGGTKTAFAIVDSAGKVMARHESGSCYYLEVGLTNMVNMLRLGISDVLAQANITSEQLRYSFIGLPAFGEDSAIQPQLENILSTILPNNNYACNNDMLNAWAGAFACHDGINIVAGTGSIAYGMRNKKGVRCGGWGELFSDEGSAYWVAIKGLNLFSRMSDNRAPKGPLYDLFKQSLKLNYDLDITSLVYDKWQGQRSKIAILSRLVSQAASMNDMGAITILREAAVELAAIVQQVRVSLEYTDEEQIPVSYSGGMFTVNDFLLEPFKTALQELSAQYQLRYALHEPVIGAALYACKLSGDSLPDTITT